METERVRINKLFVWKFTLTSFAFGLFLGIIISFILILASLSGLGQTTVLNKQIDVLSPSFTFMLSLIIILVNSLLFAFLGFLFAGFYNLVSRIGLNLDLGLVQVEQKEIIKEESKQEEQTIQPAPSNQNTSKQFY